MFSTTLNYTATGQSDPHSHEPLYRLTSDLVWSDKTIGANVTVPTGFETDFASMPWFIRQHRYVPIGLFAAAVVLALLLHMPWAIVPALLIYGFWLWAIIEFSIHGRIAPACVVHDFILTQRENNDPNARTLTECDAILLQALLDCGASSWKAHTMVGAIVWGLSLKKKLHL